MQKAAEQPESRNDVAPYYDRDGITIYCGDNVATMKAAIPDASIDLVVTSPPYDNLRTYEGHSWDFEGVAQQLWRVVKPGGVVVWIVKDQTIDGSETGSSFLQALRFIDIGFNLHDTMIWEKTNGLPGDGKHRYHDSFEYMFVVSSGAPKSRNILTDIESDRGGEVKTKVWDRRKSEPRVSACRKTWVSRDVVARTNIWKMSTATATGSHPAAFPESLARDHILSWSNEGDTVLDPFSGSGTTVKMAHLMGRRAVGIEISEKYCEIAVTRLRQRTFGFV